jgi:septal ring factor EnvC (AmiA/AmiB activator)
MRGIVDPQAGRTQAMSGADMTKILAGLLIVSIIAASGLGWMLKAQIAETGKLKAQNAQLITAIQAAKIHNDNLKREIKKLESRRNFVLAKIAAVEASKAELSKQLDRKNAALRSALADARQWSDEPIPKAVADSVNDTLSRLFNNPPGSDDRG